MSDILQQLRTPVIFRTIDGVDVMGHPCGALDDLLKEAGDEIERLQAVLKAAIDLAVRDGGTDGAHHKAWVIDQMVKLLAGDNYDTIVAAARNGEDGPETYDWDCGIAP